MSEQLKPEPQLLDTDVLFVRSISHYDEFKFYDAKTNISNGVRTQAFYNPIALAP